MGRDERRAETRRVSSRRAADGRPVEDLSFGDDSSRECGTAHDIPCDGREGADALFGPPGAALAAAVHQASDPLHGWWPVGSVPEGASTAPWADVVHVVAAARRAEGWALWAQLTMVARLLVAWRLSPPISDTVGATDRCAGTDPALTDRLNTEAGRAKERVGRGWDGDTDLLAEVFASSEISLACGFTRYAADHRVDVAEALFVQGRLPRLRRLLRSGWVDWYKLETFVRETSHLDVVVANAVERMILGEVEPDDTLDVLADPSQPGLGLPSFVRMTVPQLRSAIAAAAAAIDAEATARRARKARSQRHVRCEAGLDGTATLTAELAVESAAAVWNALTAAAKAAKAAGDPRALDQLRADELLARATRAPLVPPDETEVPPRRCDGETAGNAAETAPTSRRGGCGTAVSLTLPLSTYLGLADDPGQLDGYGPVAAGLARQILRDAERSDPTAITWRCVIVDDTHSTVLGVGTPLRVRRHDPPPRLADLVRTRDTTCSFPGCRVRARECDLDHRIAYDHGDPGRGPTCSCNLQVLCRAHHQLKTAGLIDVRVLTEGEDPRHPAGTLEFTTRTGLRYRRPPAPATPRPAPRGDPQVAAAVACARARGARDAEDEERRENRPMYRAWAEQDHTDRAWRASLAEYGRERVRHAAAGQPGRGERQRRAGDALADPPF